MLRIGLVGCGTHAGWAVIPSIAQTRGRCKLVAAADINADHLEKIEDASVARFTDHREMLAKADVDAVYISTLVDVHAAVAIDAFDAGLHVICEKPMASTADECRRMVDAAARAGRLLAVDFETRFYPAHVRIRQWIDEGRLGRIEAIHIQHFWDGHKTFGPLAERRHRFADLSGALDCGIHKADIIRYWCGGRWTDIRSAGRWFGEDTRYPTHIAILGELDNGVMATLDASFAYGAYIEEKAHTDILTIVGMDGVVSQMSDDNTPGVIRLTSKHGSETLDCEALGHAEPMTQMLCTVADVIEGRRQLPPEVATGDDGLMAQMFTEQANEQAVARRRRR